MTINKFFKKLENAKLKLDINIDLFTETLLDKVITNRSKIKEHEYFINSNENNNFTKILEIFNEYYNIINDEPYCMMKDFFKFFMIDYKNSEKVKILQCFTDNIFKYYLLLFLIKAKKYNELKFFIDNYKNNFNNMKFYIDIFKSLNVKNVSIYNENLSNENLNNENIFRIKLFNNNSNKIYLLDIIKSMVYFMNEYVRFHEDFNLH